MNNNINLLGHRDGKGVSPASGKLKILRAIAVVLLFGVSSASIMLYILISFSALPQVQQQEQQALQSLAASHPEMTKIALVQDRLAGINAIFSKRSQYDKFFDGVTQKMSAGMAIQQVSLKDKNASLTIKGDSLDSMNVFLDKLVASSGKNKEYAQIVLNNITSSDANSSFLMTVSFVLP